MTRLASINYTIQLLLDAGELGHTDSRKLNQLLSHVNADGWVDKEQVIREVFADGKNPDNDLRNFLTRLRNAVKTVAADAGRQHEPGHAEQIGSIRIDTLKAGASLPARLAFSVADLPPALPATPRPNANYQSRNYQPLSATDPLDENKPQAFTLFISFAEADSLLVNLFIRQFEELIASAVSGQPLLYWSMHNLIAGKDFNRQIRSALDNCHYGLALVSEAFTHSEYITDVELANFLANDNIIPVGLDGRLHGKPGTPQQFFAQLAESHKDIVQRLAENQICHLKDPLPGHFYNDCSQEASQRDFVAHVFQAIQQRIDHDLKTLQADGSPPPQALATLLRKTAAQPITALLGRSRSEQYPSMHYQPAWAAEHLIRSRVEIMAASQPHPVEMVSNVELLPALLDWAQDRAGSPLFALLGDYGMGKTFSCRVFAEQLQQLRRSNSRLPTPVYLDLRDVRTFVQDGGINRQPYLPEILDDILHCHPDAGSSSADIIQAARQGRALLIFDGLDEKTVFYTKEMSNRFLNQLLSIYPQDQPATPVKILLSCRSHHFESLKQQDNFFTGLGRSGIAGSHYRALTIQPFSEIQMQGLLSRLLSAEDSRQVFAFIQDERYLKDLAARPFMLNKLAQTLPRLQALKAQGRPINAAGFYQALIDDTIHRDDEKHILQPRHKWQLLADLAAAFWRQATQSWRIDQLNEWFQDWLHAHPCIHRQYHDQTNAMLETDLRNSTLLVRFGQDDFGFAHSSMQEYFLACWLLRQWLQEQTAFDLPQAVSSLTRQFLLDSLPLLQEAELMALHAGMVRTLAQPFTAASQLALAVIAALPGLNLPSPQIPLVDLRTADLTAQEIAHLNAATLLLNEANAYASRWLDCRFERIEAETCHLHDSLWRRCHWQQAYWPLPAHLGVAPTLADCVCPPPALPALCRQYPLPAGRLTALAARSIGERQVFMPHGSWISQAVFSPDGQHVLTASGDCTARLWDMQGRCLLVFSGHGHWVTSAVFSPDGSQVLTSSHDRTAKLWDIQSNCLLTFSGHDDSISSAVFIPDGSQVLTASQDGTARLWDMQGRCLLVFSGHVKGVNSAVFSPDGSQLLTASSDNTARLWDIQGHCLLVISGHNNSISSAIFSPDGSQILTVSQDGTARLWDMQGRCLQTFSGHVKGVNSAMFSHDGSKVLTASGDKTARLWNMQGCCELIFFGHDYWVRSAVFSPNGSLVLTASQDGTSKLWDMQGRCLLTLSRYSYWVPCVAFNPNGRQVLTVSEDNTAKLWDMQGRCLLIFNGHDDGISSVVSSLDGNQVLTASWDNTARLWDMHGHCVLVFSGHDDTVNSAVFSPDGNQVLTASDDQTSRLWDMQGNCLLTFSGHDGGVHSAVFSPDGNQMLTASSDNTAKLWDLQGHCLLTFSGHDGGVYSAVFSPDGNQVLTTSIDNIARLWDLQGHCLLTFSGHDGGVYSAVFSPDGSQVLTASWDKTARLWDLQGNCLLIFAGHDSPVLSAAFSPDGRHVLLGLESGITLLCNARTAATEWMYCASREQWWSAQVTDGTITRLQATELAWKTASLMIDGQPYWLDDAECFEYCASG